MATHLGDEGGDHAPDAAEGGAEAHPQRAHRRRVHLHRKPHISTHSYFDTTHRLNPVQSGDTRVSVTCYLAHFCYFYIFSKIQLNPR